MGKTKAKKEFRFSSCDHRDAWARKPERALVDPIDNDEIFDLARDTVPQPLSFIVSLSQRQLETLVEATSRRRGEEWLGDDDEGLDEPEQARFFRLGHTDEACEVLGELLAEALEQAGVPSWERVRFSWSPATEDESAPVAIQAPGAEQASGA